MTMTRGRYYSIVMPIWAIIYAIGLFTLHSGTFAFVGALVFGLLAVIGTLVLRPCEGRQRNRVRTRG